MRCTRILSGVLVLVMILALLPMMGTSAQAANATTIYKAGDTTYAILNSYTSNNGNTAGGASYGSANQGGEALAQDGFVKKSATPYVAWMVNAPSAGWYTFDPVFNIGHFDATPKGKYNAVISVNDSRYYVGPTIESDIVGTYNVKSGMSTMEVYLDKGINTVRFLPLSGPDHYYNRITVNGSTYNVWVDVHSMGIDSRLTVCKAEPLTLDTRVNTASYQFNKFAFNANYDCVSASSTGKAKELNLNLDSLNQENLEHMPYISYTLNAPADGYYDMDVEFSSGGAQHGADGYLIVRVNGTNYRRWISGTGFAKTNISVPLKKGDNTVVVTCGLGMKGGTSDQRYEQYHNALSNISWFRNLTVSGGVTLSATQIDPKTVADAPVASTKLEAETYGVSTVPADLSGVTGLPSTRQLWEGEWLDRATVPTVTFTVNAAKAGTYTVRPVYKLATSGDALAYAVTGGVNDSSWDKARFEPLAPLSRTDGYSELTLELEKGINVIRILPVTDGNALNSFELDYIQILGNGAVTGVMPQTLELKSAEAEHINLLTVDGDVLSGSTGTVASYAAVNGSNLDKLGWFAYTVNVPAEGYYDLYTGVGGGSGDGSLVMIVDGLKQEIPVVADRELANNPVNLSMHLTAGDHTVLVSGPIGQTAKLGALTVSGGIKKASIQKDPLAMGVQPAVKEGGLVPGSVYSESDYQLTGIPANTTGAQFKSNFLDNETAQFLDASGNALSDSAVITTGCAVLYPNGSYYKVSEVLTAKSPRSIGADQILALCNPVGRLVKTENAIHMEMSASNFTLTGELEGDVSITLDCDAKMSEMHSFYVEVDGKLSYFEVDPGRTTLTVAEDLAPGQHTIKVHKGTDNKKEIFYIHSVTYTGQLKKAEAAARRIEVLGDSITAGSGVFFGDCGYGYTQSWFIYANMMADAFGADHYSVANGGWRFHSTFNPSTSIATIYDDLSMHDASLGAYDFSWDPDLIIINLGTNDAIGYRTNKTDYTQESFAENIKIMLDLVREKNPDAEIIWMYGSMLTECEAWIKAPVEEYAKTDPKIHYVSVRGNTKGRGDHPDFDGHTKVAITLTEAVSEIMGWQLPTGTHATGDCDPETCEFCIRNAETLPKHTYTDACDTTCNYIHADGKPCEHTRVAPHTFADCTDTTCENCTATRTAQSAHSYKSACDDSCENEGCNFKRTDVADHTFDADCTDAECNLCGAEREAESEHTFSGDCDTSCNNTGCEHTRTVTASHLVTDCEDTDCNVCGATRAPVPHTGGTATCKEQAQCGVCGKRYGALGGHSGGTATCKEKAVCSVCTESYGQLADHSFNKGTCGVCGAADPDYRPPVNPETGDRAPIALLAAMAVLSMLSAAVVIRKKEF